MRRNGFKIEEIGTDGLRLETLQDAVLPILADYLVKVIRSRLDNGQYIIENGFVKLREEVSDEQLSTASRLNRN
jgi:hypothetical protein